MKELCYRNNPKSLFRKYSRLITSLTKHQAFRDFVMDGTMPLSQEKLGLFLPNGYHLQPIQIGKNKWQGKMVVTTRAVYFPKLYFSLLKLDLMLERWSLSFEDQQTVLLMDIGLKRYSFEYPRIFLAQSTFNPDANPETTSVDGEATEGTDNQTWATKHDAADGTTANDSSTSFNIYLATGTASGWLNLRRTFTLFDSSSLPDNATIDTTTKVRLYVSSKDTDVALTGMRIVTTTPASNTAIVAADYDQLGTIAQAPDLATASVTAGAYNDFDLNATGDSNVSLTGITKFGCRFVADADNSEPTRPGNGIDGSFICDSAEGTNKPQLVVDYTVGGSYSFFM